MPLDKLLLSAGNRVLTGDYFQVDVYSFGIVMSELLTRRLPFRDQYKIKSYMDVVDAVLDDGAMPTLPPWTGDRLRRLIESCLSRNPASRPSFMSLILKLRSMFAATPEEMFVQFDLPRITAMLTSSDRHNQALAARELANFPFEDSSKPHAICSRCKHAPGQHQQLSDELVSKFLTRFTQMLSSSSAKVVLPAVEAMGKLIHRGQLQGPKQRQNNLNIIRDNEGVHKLLALVGSRNETIREAASKTLLLLTNDLPVDDRAYRALQGNALSGLHALLETQVEQLSEKKKVN